MFRDQEHNSLDFSLPDCSTSGVYRKLAVCSNKPCRKKFEISETSNYSYQEIIQTQEPQINYPQYSYELELDTNGLPKFVNYNTISRHLFDESEEDSKICPYGDEPAQLACIKETDDLRKVRNAYTLSALRFRLNPFKDEVSSEANKVVGIPTALQSLYEELVSGKHLIDTDQFWKSTSLEELIEIINNLQREIQFRYEQELAPRMNANPLDPTRHAQDLSPEMMHDLSQYVQLQNSPHLFFDLMQWLEKDVAIRRWRSFQSARPLSTEESIVLVMTSWRDQDCHRRKKPIYCPTGVPLSYMQSLRRRDQPFITQEFSDHAHGGLNHWLQEHVWQRFCARYPEKCRLHPSAFFKQLGHLHFAFADAIYELHMPNVANPANTNFWSVLQYYLPLMSPWP